MPRDFGRTRSAGTATADRDFALMSQGKVGGLLQEDLAFRLVDMTAYSHVSQATIILGSRAKHAVPNKLCMSN